MSDPTAILRMIGIRGGIAIALGLALVFTMWRADSLSESLDSARKEIVVEQAKHAVTRASLGALQAELEAFVKAGQLRKENRDKALESVAKETEDLRKQAEAFDIETVEGV